VHSSPMGLARQDLVPGGWRLAAPAIAMTAWGGNHYSPLLLMYRQLDGYTAVEVNLFFAFYVLGLIPGFLVAGPFSDEHGRKRLVTVALLLGIVGSIILALGGASAIFMCAGRLVSTRHTLAECSRGQGIVSSVPSTRSSAPG